jgi:4-hydroxy-tetrahydrodipicolinate synthase
MSSVGVRIPVLTSGALNARLGTPVGNHISGAHMAFDSLRQRLAGVVAITVTPFTSDDSIDDDALATITERMAVAGIGVVTPNGNTGEFYSLTHTERRRCLDVVAEASGEALVLAGVGGGIGDAIASACEAREAGAAAVMVHQPLHPFVTSQGWVEYHREIASAVPELGLVPYVKSARVTAEMLSRLAEAVPAFVGIKYALPDPVDFASILTDAVAPNLVWIAGLAESYAASQFALTATGFTSGLANIAPTLSLDYLRALQSGDYASALTQWQKIREFEELRARDGNALNVSVVKEALHQIGLCSRAVRPPITTLEPDDRDRVSQLMSAWQIPLSVATV